jgi:hypothetical protein
VETLTAQETWVSLNRFNAFGAVSGDANAPLAVNPTMQHFL